MKKLSAIVMPVISDMKESHIKQQLLAYFPLQEEKFSIIENTFQALTAVKQDPETLRSFFHSWSQTNNSAVTVAGLSNRITMMVHENQEVLSEHDLFKSVASLNRIVDEDLAVVGQILHSILFYRMATNISGDDSWLSHRYLCTEAKEFKAWKDKNSLRNKDIMIGLLTTLVHEIYTHGEVEFILPLFENWLKTNSDLSEQDIQLSLAWIAVHCGPTEKNHFFHAVDAVYSFAKATGLSVEDYDLKEIITTYLTLKAEVMSTLNNQLVRSGAMMQ
ncbi:hypothetical protein [Fluviicola taffensis]|uniref:hypothetical protein n=1 Tax=Fluviicola taffensis TaxID=191579 RepID=UPI0031382E81